MTTAVHPRQALFSGEKSVPSLPVCEHFAGSEKLIGKASALQREMGPVFDITCDCEDGAPAGREEAHAAMIAEHINSEQNSFDRLGVRIHDPAHPAWRQDVDIIVSESAARIAYVTIPKATTVAQVFEVIDYIQSVAQSAGVARAIPVHVLIETHGALEQVFEIAKLPHIEVLDFGLMDFVSAHHGAISTDAMRSPAQFEHPLIVRAKTRVVAAALAHGIVPAHNVCLSLKDDVITSGDAFRARNEFGFLRMWSIYPAQIGPIIAAMQPSAAEMQDASAILLAAQDASWGPIQYGGDLHDRATYRYFWSLLEKAKSTGMAVPEPALIRFF